MKALSDTQAEKCELSRAPVSQCRCRCRGLQHGAAYWGGADPNGPERAMPLPGYEDLFVAHPRRSPDGSDVQVAQTPEILEEVANAG